jgi:ribosome-associated heat shock protein Hsp15
MVAAEEVRDAEPTGNAQRLDKWLWFARVTKSRSLAAQLVQDGKVRINRARAAKPSQAVRPDDILTIAVRGEVQVLKVLAPGLRRGPPAEARRLYEVLSQTRGARSPPVAGD